MGDRVVEERPPGDRGAEFVTAEAVRLPPAGHGPGHRERDGSAPRRHAHAVARAIPVGVDGRRRSSRGVQAEELLAPAVVDQPDVVAAHAVHVGIDDGARDAPALLAAPSPESRSR